MDCEKLSDFEVNKMVADKLGIYWHSKPEQNKTLSWIYSDNYCDCNTKIDSAVDLPDYCNNPADAWPIIVGNKISIEFRALKRLEPMAKRFGSNTDSVVNENPLRAAMIVFLMMNEGE